MNVRKYLTLCACILSTSLASAQYNTLSEWYLGGSAGASASTITTLPKWVDKMFTVGSNGGVVLRYVSEPHFGIQMECNSLSAGWKEDYYGSKDPKQYSYQRNLQWIEVPLLAHLYSKAGPARFFINVGPKASLLLNESEVNRSPKAFPDHGVKVQHKQQFSLVGGLGMELHWGRTAFGIEGRYSYYTTNLFNDAITDDFATSDLQVITLNAHVLMLLHYPKK
jgi:hypothetical protein